MHLVVENVETPVDMCSISPSGLAILSLDDTPGTLRPLLAHVLAESHRIRVTAGDGAESVAVDVNLVWVDESERMASSGHHIDVIVDGSDCSGWSRLLQVSRITG